MLVSFVGSACSTAKFDSKKPIERDWGFFFGRHYKQGEEVLDRHELANDLRRNPASEEAMTGYRATFFSGMLLSVSGGFLIGWHIGNSSPNKSSTPLYVGLGLAACGITLGAISQGILDDGVDSHNKSLQRKPASVLEWHPIAGIAPDSQGAAQGMAGVRVDF